MSEHMEKSPENKSTSVVHPVVRQRKSESSFHLIDNRSEATVQAKIQHMANNSPHVQQLKASQAMADNYTSKKANHTGLPNQLKAGVENLSGLHMDDVKVHYNSAKPAQLQAHAYAQGTAIHLAPGQKKHLAHEAWHVVQQKKGQVKPTVQMKGQVNINDDVRLEKEADVMGAKALQVPGEHNSFSKNTAQLMSSGNLKKGIHPAEIVQGVFVDKLESSTIEHIRARLKHDHGITASYKQIRDLQQSLLRYGSDQEIADAISALSGASSSAAAAVEPVAKAETVAKAKPVADEPVAGEPEVSGKAGHIEADAKPASKASSSAPEPAHLAAAAHMPEEEAGGGGEIVEILRQYKAKGLLIHSIQIENAKFEADNLIVTIEDAVHNQETAVDGAAAKPGQKAGHSGKRNWSLIHEQLKCIPYEMGEEGQRFMGVLAKIENVSNQYLKVYLSDASSNSKILGGQTLMEEADALRQIEGVLQTLKGQATANNSEIQTLGIDPNATGALVFHKVKFNMFKKQVQPQTWEEAKPFFQMAINEMAERGGRATYHIFTFVNKEAAGATRSELVYLATMSAHRR